MRSFLSGLSLRHVMLALAVALLAACGGRSATKGEVVQAANIPATFDVTVLAEKDNQFDFEDAPLTSEDLRSAFRYRQEESLPMSTVLLKRGEKQKVKKEHINALTGIARTLNIKAYVLESDGKIAELQARNQD